MSMFSSEKWDSNSIKPIAIGSAVAGDVDLDPIDSQIQRYRQDTKYRKSLACWVMWIVPAWLTVTIAILVMQGFFASFYLSSEVLITLLATTTVNVLGLAFIVLQGIFPKK